MRWFIASPAVIGVLLTLGLASSALAAPEMFEASFIFHAWGHDVSSGWTSPYTSNAWTAAPLGYDCAHAGPYTLNGGKPDPRYCSPAKMQKGHPATGMWTRSIGTGSPPAITMQQSDFGIQLYTHPVGWPTQTDTDTPHCCRGILITFPPYPSTFTYATFVNAAGSFFAGGGAAATAGYNNRRGYGSWRIRAGKSAFGGAMALLGKYGGSGVHIGIGPNTYVGAASRNMIKALGRPLFNTIIGYDAMGQPLYQNPYTRTGMLYATTWEGGTKTLTTLAVGLGTLWTTGQVGNFAKSGAYYTSLYRTGYDNRTAGGLGNIQLVTPTLTRWLSPYSLADAQIGMLTIRVPEPSAMLLLAAGAGALVVLHRLRRRD